MIRADLVWPGKNRFHLYAELQMHAELCSMMELVVFHHRIDIIFYYSKSVLLMMKLKCGSCSLMVLAFCMKYCAPWFEILKGSFEIRFLWWNMTNFILLRLITCSIRSFFLAYYFINDDINIIWKFYGLNAASNWAALSTYSKLKICSYQDTYL